VNVDATADMVHNFKHKHSLTQIYSGRTSIDCSPSKNKRIVYTKINLRGQCHTYLCLNGQSDTYKYAVSPVLCSILARPFRGLPKPTIFITFCALSAAKGMVISMKKRYEIDIKILGIVYRVCIEGWG